MKYSNRTDREILAAKFFMEKGNRMIRSWKRIVVGLAGSGLLCAHSMAADFFGKPFAWKTGMYSSVEGETVTVSLP